MTTFLETGQRPTEVVTSRPAIAAADSSESEPDPHSQLNLPRTVFDMQTILHNGLTNKRWRVPFSSQGYGWRAVRITEEDGRTWEGSTMPTPDGSQLQLTEITPGGQLRRADVQVPADPTLTDDDNVSYSAARRAGTKQEAKEGFDSAAILFARFSGLNGTVTLVENPITGVDSQIVWPRRVSLKKKRKPEMLRLWEERRTKKR